MGERNWGLKRLNVQGHSANENKARPWTPVFDFKPSGPLAALDCLGPSKQKSVWLTAVSVLAAATALKVISALRHLTTQILTIPALIPSLGLFSHCFASWHRIPGNASTSRYWSACLRTHSVGVWSVCCMATFFPGGLWPRQGAVLSGYTFLFFSLKSADPEGFWKNLYDFFRACYLPGVFLPGQFDLGCGHHGIWGAEPGNHWWNWSQGEEVPGDPWDTPGRAGGQWGLDLCEICCRPFTVGQTSGPLSYIKSF